MAIFVCAVLISASAQTNLSRAPSQPINQIDSPVAQPKPVEPCANITQQEYERALTKWRARGVLEYEVTVDSPSMGVGGRFRLHVLVENGQDTLVGITDLNIVEPESLALETLAPYELDFYRERTVEGMFREVGKLFTGELTDPAGEYEECFNVEFDRALGYPSLVRSGHSPIGGGPPATDCCINYEVLNLRIVRSGLPGMPKSGNPGA